MPADNRAPVTAAVPWGVRLSVAALVLQCALLAPRGWILYNSQFTDWPTRNPALDLLKLCAAGSHDAGFVAGLASAFLLLLVLCRRNGSASRFIYGSFVIVTAACLVVAVAHTRVLAVLGRPFNYQWLYYSDFLRSIDSREALLASLQWEVVAAAVLCVSAYLLIGFYMGKWVEARMRGLRIPGWAAIGALVGALFVWSVFGQFRTAAQGWPSAKLANPVYEFAKSWLMADGKPALFTMRTTAFETELAPDKVHTPLVATTLPAIKHVILFVLESTPAEYLGVYGSALGVTPNLDKWAAKASVFENIYAHAPATNKSLFSILCSTYPWISYKSETEEKAEISLPSIVSELRDRGYATGFFSSGDLSFQSAGKFLHAQGFEHIEDYKQRKNSRTIFRSEQWPFLNGSDDISTAESLAVWFEKQHKSGKPVFGMLWTNMTHYPYFTDSILHQFGKEEKLLNRYLNALHIGDRAFGTLMQSLEKAGIAGETLVVVVGDHGEAFGRHNQWSHAGGIYEENCHVPLMLINAKLFKGQRHPAVGGLIDIAPAIMDVLGKPPSEQWQGRSLFSDRRTNRTYFFSPWSDYLFGYRDGNMKFLYNASGDRYEIYDLSHDPQEKVNLVAGRREQIGPSLSRLAGWVQYQDRLFRRLMANH
jgi:phosphoglycerol transferase MdoB-like AlkP superfamily enzyme